SHDEDTSDVTDALAHADDESLESSPVDLGGACPMEPELPLLLYDGELTGEERAKLEAHVAKCARCEGALGELKATAEALTKSPLVVPRAEKWSRLKDDVLAKTSSGKTTSKKPSVAKPAVAKPAVAKAVKPASSEPATAPVAAASPSSTPSEAVAAAVCATFE